MKFNNGSSLVEVLISMVIFMGVVMTLGSYLGVILLQPSSKINNYATLSANELLMRSLRTEQSQNEIQETTQLKYGMTAVTTIDSVGDMIQREVKIYKKGSIQVLAYELWLNQ